ncbi:uncharacterized protein LOC127655151 [Xyrauchen texanus]|uniref:uncharacterized protein LOC127655151 n=1 Tax=Xyrauchen texanus TaxID=154827 RepID=UPI002241E7E1|nr:uncharacterized protein LOC127655151 [Xyrauchen texanus]
MVSEERELSNLWQKPSIHSKAHYQNTMKDFVLSLLSRGHGQVVPDQDGHYGRLEVCFEPEDYFNWKTQPTLLRLTSSGRFLGGMEPVPPKTYSTRRGPLILYSEDLALSYQSGQVNRKRKAPSCPKQELENQLHTLQDLTGAILAYGKKQSKVVSLAGVTHPLLPDPKHASKHIHLHQRTAEKSYNSSQVKAVIGGEVRYQPRFLSSPRPNRAPLGPLPPITEGLVHIQSQEKAAHLTKDEQMAFKTKYHKDQKKLKEKKKLSLRIEVDTCRPQMSPIPETEPTQADTTDQTEDQTDLNGHGKRSLIEIGNGVGETCTLKSVYVDPSLENSPLSRINYYGGYMEGFRQMRHCGGETFVRRVNTETDYSSNIFHLPSINQSPLVNSGSDSILTMNKPEIKEMVSCKNTLQRELHVHLPDIKLGTTQENHSERGIHRKVLVLLPPQTEHIETHQPDDAMHGTPVEDSELYGDVEHTERLAQREKDPFTDSKFSIIEMDPGHVIGSDALGTDQHLPQGPLPPLVGRRGPGKQSSMAVYRQNLHEPADTTEPQTGNTRGCLPLELREWQGGKAVGTLIMGPEGEIIRLSLWDPTVDSEDHPIMGDVTQGHVLKLLTSEGDLKQPWEVFLQDHATDKGEVATCNPEATTSKKAQLYSSHEFNKPAEQIYARKRQDSLGSYNTKMQDTQINNHAETCDEEEEDDDCFSSESEITDKSKGFTVNAHAKQNAEDDEDHLGSDNEINQETHVFKINSHAKHTKAKRKEDCLGSDSIIIQETQVFKVNSHAKQTKAKRKEDSLGSVNKIIEETQVFLPEERLEELNSSTTHQPSRTGEGATGVQRSRKVKASTLQPETGVTPGSWKSKGAAPAISPKSTHFTTQAHSPGESTEIQTGLPLEADNNSKGHYKSRGGTEDAEHPRLEKIKKNIKVNKHISKSKGKTVQIRTKVEGQNTRVVDDIPSTAKQKKKKSKEDTEKEMNTKVPDNITASPKQKKKKSKEETEKEKEGPTKSHNPRVKDKKKKGQPAFVVGKPQRQEVEWIANKQDEPERPMIHERQVMTPKDKEDDKLENSSSQDNTYIDSDNDMGADTDSESTETCEEEDSPRSVYSIHRSQHSHVTALSDPSTHRLSQNSHRSTSMGVAAHCSPCSNAALSLIHMPSQPAHHPASNPTKSESCNDVKSSEEPVNKIDRKAAALAEKAERRREEVERKRKEREEEKKRQQEKEAREERMRIELEEEQRRRAEEARLQKIKEEEERRRRQEEDTERQRREQAEKERERRRQEEKRRLLERLQRERQEEEKRQAAELERQRLEEEALKEEECRKLSEMEEVDRLEYLRRQKEEEEQRRKAAEERKRKEEDAAKHAEEEARLQAELFARQRAALEQHLKFHRGLFVEAGGLEQTQDISRPWVFSYFTLLKLLGLAEPTSTDEDTL